MWTACKGQKWKIWNGSSEQSNPDGKKKTEANERRGQRRERIRKKKNANARKGKKDGENSQRTKQSRRESSRTAKGATQGPLGLSKKYKGESGVITSGGDLATTKQLRKSLLSDNVE